MMFLLEFFCAFSKLVLGWSVFLHSGMLPVYRGEPSFLLFVNIFLGFTDKKNRFSWADLLDVGMIFLLEFFCAFSKLVLGWSVFLPFGMLLVYRGEPSFLLFVNIFLGFTDKKKKCAF